jgi:hypothetical protein
LELVGNTSVAKLRDRAAATTNDGFSIAAPPRPPVGQSAFVAEKSWKSATIIGHILGVRKTENAKMARNLQNNLSLCTLRMLASVAVGITFLLNSSLAVGQMGTASSPRDTASNWKQVEDAMGRPGQMQPGDVIKFSMPRKDLHITLKDVDIKPGLALGSWAAFKRDGGTAMVMGDLVLSEDEVQAVMRKLQDGGIEETALHNHLMWESPRVMYMHIASHGDAIQMAKAIHEALMLSKTPGPDAAPGAQATTDLGFDQKQVEQILGHTGKIKGGILQVSVPRSETITDSKMIVPPSMGVATALNFQPTGNNRAAITGDFVLLGSEVNSVMRALRENGIEVTALHSHMLTEEPRLFFMHFWAHDDALKLAKGLRAALDKTNSAK